MKEVKQAVLVFVITVLMVGCAQREAVIPDNLGGSGDLCGPWYAGGEEAIYDLEEGATFPCYVWTSVRKDELDTRLNMGELYLDFAEGVLEHRALVVLISGAKCPSCKELISGLKEYKEEIDELAMMVALNSGEPALDIVYDLDEAYEVLVDEEGWPSDWYVTNDVEQYVEGYQSFPWLVVVRLSDMAVIKHSNAEFGRGNIRDLIELLETF